MGVIDGENGGWKGYGGLRLKRSYFFEGSGWLY